MDSNRGRRISKEIQRIQRQELEARRFLGRYLFILWKIGSYEH